MDPRAGYALKRLQVALRTRMDDVLSHEGLTTPQYSALSALEQEAGLSNAELARRSFVTPQTMIRILDLLEAAGLLARVAHPTHGRVLQVVLTEAGQARVAACHAGVNAVEAQMLGPLSTAERVQLNDLLGRCAEALEAS